MVTTDDDALADRMCPYASARHRRGRLAALPREGPWGYDVVVSGFKYNISDIHSALVAAASLRAPTTSRRNAPPSLRYNAELAEPLDRAPPTVEHSSHCWHLYAARAVPGTIDRQTVIQALADDGIGISVHFKPLHLHTYYAERYQHQPEDFPVALDHYERAFSLLIFMDMTDADIDRVINVLRSVPC